MATRRVVFLGRYHSRSPHAVFELMADRLSPVGIEIVVDNAWSDEYASADLLIAAEPLPDEQVPPACRILGQRTLNRRTRLDVAVASGAAVAAFGGPRDDDELTRLAAGWNAEAAVLKYDWSTRRSGVFFWPLEPARRRPFPADFDPEADVFMAFLGDDPRTYKVDAFGGVVLGAYVLPTRDMRVAAWEAVTERTREPFDLPEAARGQIAATSAAMLEHGVGYASFDLMRTAGGFHIIEANTSSVSVAVWDDRPEEFAAGYADGIIAALDRIDRIPRYATLREQARRCGNDREAKGLPTRTADGEQADGERGAAVAAPAEASAQAVFMRTLAQTDRMASSELRAFTTGPLETLLRHAREHVPFYASRLNAVLAPNGSIDLDAWSQIPVVSRSDLDRERQNLIARAVPAEHGSVSHVGTAGTEHEPVTISSSRLASAVTSCIHMRFFAWHGVPFSDAVATIRDAEPQHGGAERKWAESWAATERGPAFEFSSLTSTEEQLGWLRDLGPVWLRTRPSLLQQMALAVREGPSLKPELSGVLTAGEIMTNDQRRLCRAFLGHEPRDLYELAEAGVVAIQCPSSDVYHVQSEAVLVEVLDDSGHGCAKGATGRLVVTPLYNLAMPLIRYDTGDLAVAGDRFEHVLAGGRLCTCGRRLPRLQSIAGRRRNQLPGRREWPDIDSVHLHDLTGARLWQVVQEGVGSFRLRLPPDAAKAGPRGADGAATYVAGRLGGKATVTVEYADIAREAGARRFEPFLYGPGAGEARAT